MTQQWSLNPSFELQVAWSVRARNRTIRVVSTMPPECSPLIRWLLESAELARIPGNADLERELPQELFELAVQHGFVVPEDEVPDEAPAVRCSLRDELFELIPKDGRDRAEAAIRGGGPLRVAHAWIQLDDDVPREIAERAMVGDELALHLRRTTDVIDPKSRFDTHGPLAWIENPISRVLEPLGLEGARGERAREVLLGQVRPNDLEPRTKLELLLAGVLHEEAPSWDSRIATLRGELASNGFVVVRDVLSPLQTAALRHHLRAMWSAGFFEPNSDPTWYPDRDGMYCERAMLYVQRQLSLLLSEVAAEKIRPTFAWALRYRPGAMLTPHVDREQCVWNVSLAIDSDPDGGRERAWPFVLESRGEPHPILLGIGDAVLYSGMRTRHSRGALDAGSHATIYALHYVNEAFAGSMR